MSSSAKTALITGITGQDGSYLAELLLGKGYEVHGLIRRSSSFNTRRLDPIYQDPHESGARLFLHYGDLSDSNCLAAIIRQAQPAEVYNLAAQSHVRVSFDMPIYTADTDATGALRLLEAVREFQQLTGRTVRYYQASSSEMFGSAPPPQHERTPFHPRSPYGCAKVFAHWATINYREAYGLHASCGIQFNHECVTADTPVIVRRNGLVDCLPISEILPDPMHTPQRELDMEIWDKGGFTRARLGTVNWNQPSNDRGVHRVIARCGEVRATADHMLIDDQGQALRTADAGTATRLLRTELPDPPGHSSVSPDWTRLLGLLAAEGHVGYDGGKYVATFRNNDSALLEEVRHLWQRLTCGSPSDSPGRSGFTGEETGGLRLNANPGILHHLYDILYTKDRSKRVPRVVLNADATAWTSFLSGYNAGDGLKAGSGSREFKNFKSSSPTLAAGLWWMASRTLDQKLTFNVDFVTRGEEEYAYYSINLGVEGGPAKGTHLLKPSEEVKRVKSEPYTGWLYDIETESGTFHAGVGDLVIHNSPRRGETFVTRKITRAVGRIKLGLQSRLYLGNLDAQRDWGFAGDYVEAMWMMLQQDKPDDYVVATGRMISVREFCDMAFAHAGLKAGDFIEIDSRYFRPSEVDKLCGNAAKAKAALGWQPRTTVEALSKMMVDADLELASREKTLRDAGHSFPAAKGHDH